MGFRIYPSNNGKMGKLYSPETHEICCNLCSNTYKLDDDGCHSQHDAYFCPECEKRMTSQYQWTWKNQHNLLCTEYGRQLIRWLESRHSIIDKDYLFELNWEMSKPCPTCGVRHTSRDWVNKFHICKDCVRTGKIPGFNHKIGINKELTINTCEKHGFFISYNSNDNLKKCPVCQDEIQTVKCARCGRAHKTENHQGDACYECMNDLRKQFPKAGDSVYPKYCHSCSSWILASNNSHSCSLCGSNTNQYKIECEELEKSDAVKEYETIAASATASIRGNILMLPMTDYNTGHHAVCSHCGRRFQGTLGSTLCDRCYEIRVCRGCGYEYAAKPGSAETCCGQSCKKIAEQKKWNSSSSKLKSLENVIYHNQRIEITDDNVFECDVPGVWYRESADGKLLQVYQSRSIRIEYQKARARINKVIESSGKGTSVDEMYRKILIDGINLVGTRTFILEIESDQARSLEIEAKFAIDNDATYWKPAPQQIEITQEYLERKKNNKEE